MSLNEALDSLVARIAPDRRVSLCDVALRGGALHGLADKRHEPEVYAFASEFRLASRVTFVDPYPAYALRPRVALRSEPRADAETVSEALYGETLRVFDSKEGFYRVATERDAYLGWAAMTEVGKGLQAPTHRVVVPRGHVFREPKVESARSFELAYGMPLHVSGENGDWLEVVIGRSTVGFVRRPLLEPEGAARDADPVSLAERFLETPYEWGGVSAWGCDCSGLVQTVYAAAGLKLPRDADQQQEAGADVALEDVRRGDLLFFPGHVAIALDPSRFLHANAHHMRVTIDAFDSEYGAKLRSELAAVRRVLP